MADQRELFDDFEEAFRSAWAGVRSHMFTALPCLVHEDSDGHTCKLQVAIKRADDDQSFGDPTYNFFPLLVDVPIHHPGGGGITSTHPVKKGDEILAVFSSRSIDSWHQSGDVQIPIFDRLHSLSDAMAVPGWRSDPRKIQQMSTATAQVRTDDKKSVIDHGPAGTHIKAVDPNTQAASADFDPFSQATKFFEHLLHPTNGHAANAVDGETTHSTLLTHLAGFQATIANGAHQVAVHPTNGVDTTSTVKIAANAPKHLINCG